MAGQPFTRQSPTAAMAVTAAPDSRAVAWLRYVLLLSLVALPLLQAALALNAIFIVFVAALMLDALGKMRVGVLLAIACLPLAIQYGWLGWLGWCLLLPRYRWMLDSTARATAVLGLLLGVALGRSSLAQAVGFTGIVAYCLFVLDSLPARESVGTDFKVPVLIQLALALLTFHLSGVTAGERFWFAINPNIDSIFLGALLAIVGANLLAFCSVVTLFRSRSGLLALMLRWLRFAPRPEHLVAVAVLPFLVVSTVTLLPSIVESMEGPARLLNLNDGSNAHRQTSLLSALVWIVENPEALFGATDLTRGIYLFYNGIFPHNAFLFSILNEGLLVFAALFWFVWSAYGRMRTAGRMMVLSLLLGLGFSDLGFDYVFIIAVISAGLLMDRRTTVAPRHQEVPHAG